MRNLSLGSRSLAIRLGIAAAVLATIGYAVIQMYDEAYLEGSRVGVSSQLLEDATAGIVGKNRTDLTAPERERLDAELERALRVATHSESALSWLQVFSQPGASDDFQGRVQKARCEAARDESIWIRAHQFGVKAVFYGPSKFELPPC